MSVPHLADGLQLVGFLVVNVILLTALVGGAIRLAVFLYMPDRKPVVLEKEPCAHESTVPAGAES